MKFLLQGIFTSRYAVPLMFFLDPGDECSIAVWYSKRTLKATGLYRHGLSKTRSLSKKQREELNNVVIPLIVRAELEEFINSEKPPEIWVELPL